MVEDRDFDNSSGFKLYKSNLIVCETKDVNRKTVSILCLHQQVCMAGRLPFPEEFVVRHEDLVEEVDELLSEECHNSDL